MPTHRHAFALGAGREPWPRSGPGGSVDERALVLRVVRERPGVPKRDVSRLAGFSSRTLGVFLVNRLVEAGALHESRGGDLRVRGARSSQRGGRRERGDALVDEG